MSKTVELITPDKLSKTQQDWPLIARDIAMLQNPIPDTESSFTANDIVRRYNLTPEAFCILMKLPAFISLVKLEFARVKELGPFAGYRLRSEIIATSLQEYLYKRAKEDQMETSDMIKFLKQVTESAGLAEANKKKEDDRNIGGVFNVQINVPRLNNPKLNHILNSSNVVEAIDV